MAVEDRADQTVVAHIESCPECREQYKLLRHYRVKDAKPMASLPRLAFERSVAAIVGKIRETSRRLRVTDVAFDSWAGLPTPVLREPGIGLERRLQFDSGPVTLELVGTRGDASWEFVARILNEGDLTAAFAIEVGRRKLLARSDGFYYWTMRRPPKRLVLQSIDTTIEFAEIAWRMNDKD